jgi:hypothetical protein
MVGVTLAMAALIGAPAALMGGADALAMVGVGAGLALLTVLGGYAAARLAFRGPDRYAVKLVVGGFVVRLVLLVLLLAALVAFTGLDPARFVLWLVTFYFVLVLAEAWLLARAERQGGPR